MVGWLGGLFGLADITFQSLLGHVFAPVFYLLGAADWSEALVAGSLANLMSAALAGWFLSL